MRFKSVVLSLGLLGLVGCSSLPTPPPTSPNSPGEMESNNRSAAELNTQLGVGYLQRGYRDLAVEKLERALELDSSYAPAHHAYALVQEMLGQDALAQSHFERALRLNPADPEVQNNYGTFLCKRGKYDDAQQAFSRAVEVPLYVTPEFAYTNSGRCYLAAGQRPEAEKAFAQALVTNGRFAPALLQMAQMRLDDGDVQTARQLMQRYEQISQHTPASLWLALSIDRALGDNEAYASHALILRGKFPDSEEARQLEGLKRR